MNVKYLLSILILLICVSFVSANTQLVNWGFSEYRYNVEDFPISVWGSNMASDSGVFESSNFEPINNYRMPFVINPLDQSVLSSNYVFMQDTSGVYVFSNTFDAISFLPLIGNNGTITFTENQQDKTKLFLYALVNSGTQYTLRGYNFTQSGHLELYNQINLSNRTYIGGVYGGKEGFVYVPDVSFNITKVSISSNSYSQIDNIVSNLSRCGEDFAPIYSNYFQVLDIDDDSHDDLMIASKKDNKGLVQRYNTVSNSWDLNKSVTSPLSANPYSCSLLIGQIGNIGSPRSIAYFQKATGTNQDEKIVFNLVGGVLFSAIDTNSGTSYSYPSIADINKDGINEFMFDVVDGTANAGLEVYSKSFALLNTIKNSRIIQNPARTNGARLYTIVDFLKNNTWLDIATPTGIIRINDSHNGGDITNNFAKIYLDNPKLMNYSISSKTAGVFAVAVGTKSANDVLIMDETGDSPLYFSALEGTICGDGICGIGETQLTCPIDCIPPSPTDAVITSLKFNPCNTLTWFLNTSVNIEVSADDKDNKPITINIDFCKDCPLGCNQKKSGILMPTGTQSFGFVANCTLDNQIIRVAATKENQITNSVIDSQFSVSAFGGISYGDSVCGISQPIEKLIPQGNTTQDPNGNAVVTGLKAINYFLKIGLPALWVLLMIAVGFVIFFFAFRLGSNPIMSFAVVVAFEGLMLVLGGLLNIIPVGIVIAIIVLFIVALIVGLSKKVSPS